MPREANTPIITLIRIPVYTIVREAAPGNLLDHSSNTIPIKHIAPPTNKPNNNPIIFFYSLLSLYMHIAIALIRPIVNAAINDVTVIIMTIGHISIAAIIANTHLTLLIIIC